MINKVQITTTETSEKVTRESIALSDTVSVVRTTTVRLTNGKLTDETGITDGKLTSKVEESVEYTGPKDPEFGYFYLVQSSLLEAVRLQGWSAVVEQFDELIIVNPFTHLQNEKPWCAVRLKIWDHTAYDLEGNPLPVGVRFDYLNGSVNNATFDLKKLLKHLESRDDVTVHDGIENVPYYNASGSCGTKGISFTWHPDTKLYREYAKKAKKCDGFNRFNVAHALLGNDKFKIESGK